MRRWLTTGLLVAAFVAAVFWGWRVLFPSPEQVIRKTLNELAQVASFSANEGALAKVANPQKLAGFFAENVEIVLEAPNRQALRMSHRTEVAQAAMAARSSLTSLRVEFLDINVSLASDKQTAVVGLTLKGNVSTERDPIVQELKFSLKKTEGDWLVYRLETVKTLL